MAREWSWSELPYMSRSLHGLNFPSGPRDGVAELLLACPGVGQREIGKKGA